MGTTHQLIIGQPHASHPLLDDLDLVTFRVVRGASDGQLPFADLETFRSSVFDEGGGLKRLCRRAHRNDEVGISIRRQQFAAPVHDGHGHLMARFRDLSSNRDNM